MKKYVAHVESMSIQGNFDLRRIYPDTYQNSVDEFAAEGIILPSSEALDLKNEHDFWLVLAPVKIFLTFKAPELGSALYSFGRGFITDLASVPSFLRGIADDNAREVIPAAFVHDANFAGHYCGFMAADRIFRDMIERKGGSFLESLIYFMGVASPVGYWLYSHRKADRIVWETRHLTVDWPARYLAK
jgi:hypothetical protein